MNRNRLLLRNCILILILLSIYILLSGKYITKEQCLKDTINTLYIKEKELIAEVEMKNETVFIMFDSDNYTASMICIEKQGILYSTGGSITSIPIRRDIPLAYIGFHASNSDAVYVVYRNDEHIKYLNVLLHENTTLCEVNEWTENFGYFYDDCNGAGTGIYKAYDKDSNLIYETIY